MSRFNRERTLSYYIVGSDFEILGYSTTGCTESRWASRSLNRRRKRQSLSRTTPRSSACRWSRDWWPATWRGSSTGLSIWRRVTILLWNPRGSRSGSYLGTLEPSKVHKEPSWYTMYAVKSTLLWSQGLMWSFTRGLLRIPRHSRKFIWRSEPATMSN